MLCVADLLPFNFRKAPDLCQWACCLGHFHSGQHCPCHLKAHTQKNTQWVITAAWKGWITYSGIPKSWVCCYFIMCFALDCRQLPLPSFLTLMGQQAFNWPSATHYLHILPRCGCLVCVCARAHVPTCVLMTCWPNFFMEWIALFCQIIPPPLSANRACSCCSDATATNKDSVIRKSGGAWKPVTRSCVWEAVCTGAMQMCRPGVATVCSADLHLQNNIFCPLFFL